MAKKISAQMQLNADAAAVFALLSNESYIIDKSERMAGSNVQALVTESGDGTVIENKRSLPADVPGFVKKFVGSTVDVTEIHEWGPAAADGSREGTWSVSFSGTPVTAGGSQSMRPSASGTVVELDGEIKASIPLLGGKIEEFARDQMVEAVHTEAQIANEWLARS